MHGVDIGRSLSLGLRGMRRADGSEPQAQIAPSPMDEIDQARAREYSLLSTLLARSPDARMIERLAQLPGDAATPLGRAHAALAHAATSASAEGVERDYFALFVGLGDGGLYPYASYYLTGFLQGRPLARLRDTLRRIGIERAPGHSEPEDHVAVLLAVMASLVGGQISAPAGANREIFEQYLAPWIGRFFADLERAQPALFYGSVGALGRVFMEIETEAFALPE